MVSFRPLSRSLLPLASSRAALFSTSSCAPSLASRHVSRRAAALAGSKLSSFQSPNFLPSSIRALTTAHEKVKVLLVLYDGGKHAQDVSLSNDSPFFPPISLFRLVPGSTRQHTSPKKQKTPYPALGRKIKICCAGPHKRREAQARKTA